MRAAERRRQDAGLAPHPGVRPRHFHEPGPLGAQAATLWLP